MQPRRRRIVVKNQNKQRVRCGNCSTFNAPKYHDSVQDVRDCYAQAGRFAQPTPVTPVPEPQKPLQRQPGRVQMPEPVAHIALPKGWFSVMAEPFLHPHEKERRRYFFRITNSRKHSGQVVYYAAGDRWLPVYDKVHVEQIRKAILDYGIDRAMKMYGKTHKRCGFCGKKLTDPRSRAFGIGPDCRRKYWTRKGIDLNKVEMR